MTSLDTIEIRRLLVTTRIGVPDTERAEAQSLWLTVRMVPAQNFDRLADNLAHTIDYQSVAREIQQLAGAQPRKLIETLAVETANFLLANHPLRSVAVTVEKHILPDTECVAVHVLRER